jgi:sulfite exporter TauE/SafE
VICNPLSVAAAFVAGLAGSGHCLAMCGGLSSALALHARADARQVTVMHAGRLMSYALAGALVGAVAGLGGEAVSLLIDLRRIAVGVRWVSALVLLAMAITLLTPCKPLAGLERVGARLWRHLAPLTRRLPANPWVRAGLLGALWGFLPCGFVYTLLLFAALAGNPLASALTLAAFGLGTLPLMLGPGVFAARWPRQRLRAVPRLAGWVLLGCSVWTLLALRMLPHP